MEELDINNVVKKEPIKYVFTNDALAGVVHYYRRNREPYEIVSEMITMFTDFTGEQKRVHNLDYVNDEDIRHANEIRSYYTKKLFLRKLKGEHRVSKFKKSMQDILSRDDRNRVTLEEFKILVKLPWFYHNDKEMDALLETYNCDVENYSQWEEITEVTELRLVKLLYIHNRRMKIVRFMFELGNTGRLAAININSDNPLLGVFIRTIEKEGLTIASGNLTINHILGSDKTYYTLSNWLSV